MSDMNIAIKAASVMLTAAAGFAAWLLAGGVAAGFVLWLLAGGVAAGLVLIIGAVAITAVSNSGDDDE